MCARGGGGRCGACVRRIETWSDAIPNGGAVPAGPVTARSGARGRGSPPSPAFDHTAKPEGAAFTAGAIGLPREVGFTRTGIPALLESGKCPAALRRRIWVSVPALGKMRAAGEVPGRKSRQPLTKEQIR